MNILFIGDIVGKPGRKAVKELLPVLRNRLKASLVIANCENAAAGFGVTRELIEELLQMGIDVLTTGNHVWDKREVLECANDFKTLLRPSNYPPGVPGFGSVVLRAANDHSVGVINLAGRVFMSPCDCPFRVAEREVALLKEQTEVIVVDFHAEATSEKKALAYFLAGRVSAVVGTHTHVQTADEEIIAGGTAYITDVGMTGPFDSIIGIRKDIILERFLKQIPNKFEVAKGDIRLQGLVLDVDELTGKCRRIERFTVPLTAGQISPDDGNRVREGGARNLQEEK